MKRTLADWASIAEVLGAIAVVISLIFVGLQVRANTRATQAATLQQSVGYEIDLLKEIATHSPETLEHYAWISQGIEEATGTTPDENRAELLYIAALRLFEDLFLQWEAGTLSEAAWESRRAVLEGFANGPGLDRYLEQGFLSDKFANYLRGLRAGDG